MDFSNAHKAHPWHGVSLGDTVPDEVRAFIEIVPTDTVKYEVDKATGYLQKRMLHTAISLQEHVLSEVSDFWIIIRLTTRSLRCL